MCKELGRAPMVKELRRKLTGDKVLGDAETNDTYLTHIINPVLKEPGYSMYEK
jgi:hypothetical protein